MDNETKKTAVQEVSPEQQNVEQAQNLDFEAVDFSPAAKGVLAGMSERAKNFTAKLYKKAETFKDEEQKGVSERFLRRVATRAEIWHDQKVEKSFGKQLAAAQEKIGSQKNVVKDREKSLATIDQKMKRLEQLSTVGKFSFDEKANERLAGEKGAYEKLLESDKAALSQGQTKREVLVARQDEFTTARHEAVDKLTGQGRLKIENNVELMANNNEQVCELGQALLPVEQAYGEANTQINLVKKELQDYKASGMKEVDAAMLDQLNNFLKQAEERASKVEEELNKLKAKKTELENNNTKLAKENLKLQNGVTNVEDKYLSPQEREARRKDEQQIIKALLESKTSDCYLRAAELTYKHGRDFNGAAKIAEQAMQNGEFEQAEQILKKLPEELRHKTIIKNLQKKEVAEKGHVSGYLDLITNLNNLGVLEKKYQGTLAQEKTPLTKTEGGESGENKQTLRHYFATFIKQYNKKFSAAPLDGSYHSFIQSLDETTFKEDADEYTRAEAAACVLQYLNRKYRAPKYFKPAKKMIIKWLTS